MSFIRINKAFNSSDERTEEFLSGVYNSIAKLKEIIKPLIDDLLTGPESVHSKRVLLKPNWVKQDTSLSDTITLRTNDNLLLAFLELLLEAKPKSITIADAPIQECDWSKLHPPAFLEKIKNLKHQYEIPIVVKDLRRVVFYQDMNVQYDDLKSMKEYVIFNLKEKSFLEPITNEGTKFRITSYSPKKLSKAHSLGKHQYCISRELFSNDVIISLPKIKTHQKTGLTAALKNLVGINGDKDFLPHHRMGGSQAGGDCYPGKNILRLSAEKTLDKANLMHGHRCYWFWKYISAILWRLSNPKPIHQVAAGWYGNDTTWRMVMDLNMIATNGTVDGILGDTVQRRVYSLSDGIIAGQGNGPLKPEPLPLGIVCFSDSSYLHDLVVAKLMGLEINKIPLLKNAEKTGCLLSSTISVSDRTVTFDELHSLIMRADMPPGWIDYNKDLL